jgi:hypothetical protein
MPRANWRPHRSIRQPPGPAGNKENPMNGKKASDTKKNGTLRPWLVDVVVDNLR